MKNMKKSVSILFLSLVCLTISLSLISAGNLVAWYKFEGNALDNLGANNGIAYGGVSYAAGISGNAIALDGVNDYVAIPDKSSLDLTRFSLGAWVYVTTAKNYNAIIVKGRDNNENYEMLLYGDSKLTSPTKWTDYTRTYLTTIPNKVPAGTWKYVAVTYNGTSRKLYINGNLELSDNPGKTPKVNANKVYIGNEEGTSGRYFKGKIDEVKIWNYALSPSEILAEYNSVGSNQTNQTKKCGDGICAGIVSKSNNLQNGEQMTIVYQGTSYTINAIIFGINSAKITANGENSGILNEDMSYNFR